MRGVEKCDKKSYIEYVTKKCDTKEKCDKKRERKCDKKCDRKCDKNCDNIGFEIVVYQGVLDEKMR